MHSPSVPSSPAVLFSARAGIILNFCSAVVLVCIHLFVPISALAATFTVTTTFDRIQTNANDFIPGTLRGAIISANTNVDADTIVFSPSLTGGASPARIVLVEALPEVFYPVILDAVSGDPSARKTPTIEITPATAPLLADGLRLQNNCVLRGVALFGFSRQLILVGRSNLVDSCNFGCSVDGEPGALLDGAAGVAVVNNFNRVVNCVASGNGGDGIVLETASNCEILGNFVGLVPDHLPLGNGGAGITIDNSRTNVIGRAPFEGNIIGGNANGGILVGSRFPDFSTRSTIIEGNVIGLFLGDFDGSGAVPGNGSHGLAINRQGQLTIRNNEIWGNHGHGIYLNGSSSIGTVIDQNQIGGEILELGNSGDGIHVLNNSRNVLTNNVIVKNAGNGIQLNSSSANQVVGNQIEANRQAGVYLNGPNSAIGQTAANTLWANSIGWNGGPGIVQVGNASQNRFYENNIRYNDGLGIDLGGTNELAAVSSPFYDVPFTNQFSRGDGPGYVRGGVNNYPYQLSVVLTNAVLSNSVVLADGYFITTSQDPLIAGGIYFLQFYRSPESDPTGYGEGAQLAGSFVIGPIPSFNASTNFSAIFTNDTLALGELITASVTRTNNSGTANQTSEFSNAFGLAPPGTNHPPVAVGDLVATLEDTPVEFAVKANDFDPDGDLITVEDVWIDAPGLGFGPVLGGVSLLANQTVRFAPATNLNNVTIPGAVNVGYLISDSHGLKTRGVAAIQITPVNDPPQAFPDLATTRLDFPVTVKTLANDKDVDGDPLTITATTPAGHGAVVINAAKSVTYTPAPGYIGVDAFGYTISDGAGGLATSDVSVLVQDTATRIDLAATQSVAPIAATTNVPVTFHLVVTNSGPLDASGVVLRVNLSPGASASQLTSSQGTYNNVSGAIHFDLGLVAFGASASADIVAIGDRAGSLVSSASVLSLVPDSFPQNDHVATSAMVTDGTEPTLAITDLGDRIRLSWGAAGTFKPEYRLDVGDSSPWHRLSGPPQIQDDGSFYDISNQSLAGEPKMLFRLIGP